MKHKGKNWGRDVDLDIVYELDDGQLFHGCRETYDASKCKNCYEAFEFNEEDNDKDCDDDCKRKKKGHRNYKRGGYSDGDCDDDCERVERCNYPFCELYDDNCDLLITLRDGVLRDEKHAIGEIVANHQFQFDKPPQRMPYTRKDSPLFTLKVTTTWLLTTRSNSGTVKLTTKGYTSFIMNLLVSNVLKLNLLF